MSRESGAVQKARILNGPSLVRLGGDNVDNNADNDFLDTDEKLITGEASSHKKKGVADEPNFTKVKSASGNKLDKESSDPKFLDSSDDPSVSNVAYLQRKKDLLACNETPIEYDGPMELRVFLRALRSSGNVRAACRVAGTSRDRIYKLKKEDEAFTAAYELAMADAVDVATAEVWRRALTGSDLLLMFLVKKLDPSYREGKFSFNGGAEQPTEIRLVYGKPKEGAVE